MTIVSVWVSTVSRTAVGFHMHLGTASFLPLSHTHTHTHTHTHNRYCGYVPQFKYQIGATFGSHTHHLLTSTDPQVAASGHPVLSETVPPSSHPPKTAEDFFNSTVYQNRTRSWGDQKYVPQMVPGYTGESLPLCSWGSVENRDELMHTKQRCTNAYSVFLA